MSPTKVITNYSGLPQDKQLPLADLVITSMTNNQYFADGSVLVMPIVGARDAVQAHITSYPHPDESQNAARRELRLTLLKAIGSVGVTVNQRFTNNDAVLLSTGLDMVAARQPLPPPALLEVFNLVDGEQEHSIMAVVEKDDSNDVLLFRYTTDPALAEKHWEACATGDSTFTVSVPEGLKLYMKVAATNRASRPDNLKFTAVKTRIAQ